MIAKFILLSAVIALAATSFLPTEYDTSAEFVNSIEFIDIEIQSEQLEEQLNQQLEQQIAQELEVELEAQLEEIEAPVEVFEQYEDLDEKIGGIPECIADIQDILPKIIQLVGQLSQPNPNYIQIITELTGIVTEGQKIIADCSNGVENFSLPRRSSVNGGDLNKCIADIQAIFNNAIEIVHAVESTQGNLPALIAIIIPLAQNVVHAGLDANVDCDIGTKQLQFLLNGFGQVSVQEQPAKAKGLPQCITDLQDIIPKIIAIFNQVSDPNPDWNKLIAEASEIVTESIKTYNDCLGSSLNLYNPKSPVGNGDVNKCIADIETVANNFKSIFDAVEDFDGDVAALIATVEPLIQNVINAGVAANVDCKFSQKEHVDAIIAYIVLNQHNVNGIPECIADLQDILPKIVALIQQLSEPNPNYIQIISELTQIFTEGQKTIADCGVSKSKKGKQTLHNFRTIEGEVVLRAFKNPAMCAQAAGDALGIFQEVAGMASKNEWPIDQVVPLLTKLAGVTKSLIKGCVA